MDVVTIMCTKLL